MKTLPTTSGPFNVRPYYTITEIEAVCIDELRSVGLFPGNPEPVRIDRFIEKKFKISHEYEDLPKNILGFSVFGGDGVERIVVARFLGEDGNTQSERRVRTTLAHEAGHALLQGHLFALGDKTPSFFDKSMDSDKPTVLCRNMPGLPSTATGRYDGRWWEFQANSAIGALLLPRPLVFQALNPVLAKRGLFGTKVLESENRNAGLHLLTEVFDVNPTVARIRIDEIFPISDENQLTF